MGNKLKIRLLPENVFFHKRKDGEYEIGLNGLSCPTIEEVEKMSNSISKFVTYLRTIGQEGIDEYNEKVFEEWKRSNESSGKSTKPIFIKGYIYVLESNDLYKIGRTLSPSDRIKTYTTENPFGIKTILVKKVENYIGVEKFLLNKFKDKNYRGEWFSLNKKDIEYIKDYLKN